MRFARWVFLFSGITGVLGMLPAYFLEARLNEDYPPPINHPEYFYGFVGVTLAWQFLFIVIGTDPVRYRLAMLAAFVEKGSFVGAIAVLYASGRVPPVWLGFAVMDGTWLVLFVIAFVLISRR